MAGLNEEGKRHRGAVAWFPRLKLMFMREDERRREGGREGTAVMRLKITDEGLKVRASEVKAMRCFVLLLNSFLKGAKKRSW